MIVKLRPGKVGLMEVFLEVSFEPFISPIFFLSFLSPSQTRSISLLILHFGFKTTMYNNLVSGGARKYANVLLSITAR